MFSQVHNINYGDTLYMVSDESDYGRFVLKDTLNDGEWNVYKDDISIKAYYKNGVKNGVYMQYYNGQLIYLTIYSDGVLNGVEIRYNSNCKLESIGYYKYGVRDGVWRYYNKKNELSRELIYEKGTLTDPQSSSSATRDEKAGEEQE